MRLRVGFDVTSAVKSHGRGIAGYVRALLHALPLAAPEVAPVLFVRGRRWLRRSYVDELAPECPRRWLLEPLRRPLHGLDLFHGLGVRLPAAAPVPRSFTLHDLRGLDAVEFTDPHWAAVRAARLRETVARADAIVCLNEFGRARLQAHFPRFPRARTAVIPHGLDHHHFRPQEAAATAALRARLRLDRGYWLQLGRLDRHKNPELSLEAFAGSAAQRAGAWLGFAGGAEDGYQPRLQALAERLGIAAQVRWLGTVAWADIPALYAAAEAVLVPSHYEGFGLPVLEAMACGAVGVVATGTCLEEVAGDAWPSAAPAAPAAWRAALDRLHEDSEYRNTLARRALARAADFTWERCARATADFLAATASSGRAGA